MSKRTTAILLIAVVALGAMTGVAAADGHLEVAVDTDADGTATVEVTENDTAVENATVVVSVVDAENDSYAGAGEYETDANGTVDLEAPDEDVTVDITAASGNETASTTVTLEAPDGLELDVSNTDGEPVVTVTNDDDPAENASITVELADDADENASYAGTGEYETDANGTVTLPAAEEDVTVEVTAEYENESVSTTADLTVGDEGDEADEQAFGQLVQEFIESLEDRDGGIGSAVSDFVTENNPGNAPDHAGGPGGPDDGNASDENDSAPGNAPDHAGGPDGENDSDERGPPAHAGPGGDDAEDDDAEEDDAEEDDAEEDDAEEDDAEEDDAEEDDAEEDDADEEDDEDDEEDDDDGGPPDHAGGPGGN
ncbi:hypothetical protein DJ68_06400 [Halorubrum sp. C3]|nr:hypothetical protein DJ68_06400 [Halorubrum sp. C3]